jgi:hypothetical protein
LQTSEPFRVTSKGIMSRLRDYQIYRLPNGRELIALAGLQGRHLLYTTQAWERSEPPMYESGEDGRLSRDGKPTAWGVDDLTDTGRTVLSRKLFNAGVAAGADS